VIAQNTVLAAGDDLAVIHNDRADGDFAIALGGAGFGDAGVEEGEVGHLADPVEALSKVASGKSETRLIDCSIRLIWSCVIGLSEPIENLI